MAIIGQATVLGATASELTTVREVAQRRTAVALRLTALLLVIYFGFLLLAGFAKGLLAVPLAAGLTLGLVIAALVIVSAWVVAWAYLDWAVRRHDTACDRLG